jgi:hypothetical protein
LLSIDSVLFIVQALCKRDTRILSLCRFVEVVFSHYIPPISIKPTDAMLERVLPASMLQSTSPKVFDQPALESSGIIPVEAKSDGDELVSKSSVVVETREVGPSLPLSSSNIKSSPYHDPRNFLNLDELSTPVRLFALALTKFEPLRPDYATSPYMATFNFDAIFGTLRDLCQDAGIEWKRQEFYVVIFRSKLRESADRVRLGELDQMSHQEVS